MTLYKIKFGLGGGFGGARDEEIVECDTLDEAENEAYNAALEYAAGYEGMYGLPDITTIMEDEDCSAEDAQEIYAEELDSWLDYSAEEYHGED